MLVYTKAPMGYIQIGCYRIYGRKFNYGKSGPTNVPYDLWRVNKGVLEEAEYTREFLEGKFNRQLPDIVVKIDDLVTMSNEELIKFARLIGINYIRTTLSKSERISLIGSIKRLLRN